MLTGIARNHVENVMNIPVRKAPRAFTAPSRLARLQAITAENQRLAKAIDNAKTKGLTREDFASERKKQLESLKKMRPMTPSVPGAERKKILKAAAHKVALISMLSRSSALLTAAGKSTMGDGGGAKSDEPSPDAAAVVRYNQGAAIAAFQKGHA